eukprot:TRINITY_DN117084_c0_g1_i1.p1 TRINITY_DN117084_c0_g1~~TRINITY_DN117084_c0_g1_i1.p1  ORF type:complete len:165 (+),score=19.48 TRINITY_DN117084_c0_g1_i1:232-726(+)
MRANSWNDLCPVDPTKIEYSELVQKYLFDVEKNTCDAVAAMTVEELQAIDCDRLQSFWQKLIELAKAREKSREHQVELMVYGWLAALGLDNLPYSTQNEMLEIKIGHVHANSHADWQVHYSSNGSLRLHLEHKAIDVKPDDFQFLGEAFAAVQYQMRKDKVENN